jgi:hypothetical protein
MKKIKETYLLFLIVVGLFSLSIYSTYALFTAEYVVGVVNASTNSYVINLSNVTEYKRINTYANENRNIILNLLNSTSNNIYYGIYTNNDSDCVFVSYDSSIAPIRGNINTSMSKTIKINVNNTCSNNYSFNLYIVTDSNTLDSKDNFSDGKKIIKDTFNSDTSEEVGNNTTSIEDGSELFIDYLNNLYDESLVQELTLDNSDKIYQIEKNNILKDNFGNIRFYGNTFNNYVKFNDELWQIIGIFTNDNNQKEIKIIKEDSITLSNYDIDISSLIATINSNYVLSDESKNMLNKTNYYQGIVSENTTTLEKIYKEERKSDVITNYLGIMYITDYIYSQDFLTCSNINTLYNNNNCSSYLTNSTKQELTMSRINDTLFTINSNVISATNTNYDNIEVRPVAYLRDDIILASGEGSRNNPYIITLG